MMRKARCWAVLTVAVALGLAACGSGKASTSGSGTTVGGTAGHPLGDAAIKAATVVAQADATQQPLDATPSPDGSVIYFAVNGDPGPAIFSVAAGGGEMTKLAEGPPLVKPTGVSLSVDGSRLFIADQQAGTSGAILTLPTKGSPGTPAVLPGTTGRAPRGLDVGSDTITFTGTDPVGGAPGLFQVPLAGGAVVTIAEGAPFTSPDSVVVNAQGVAFVTDQGFGPSQGSVFRVSGGTVTPVLAALHLGAPAGLTLLNADATLLVSSIDANTGSDQVLFVDLASGKSAAATKVIGVNKNSAGGLHRAHNSSVLAWADVSRGGRVYRVEPGNG